MSDQFNTITEKEKTPINGVKIDTTNDNEPTELNTKSFRIIVEKLSGGFISDAEGKRKIYSESEDVADAIGVPRLLNKLNDGEYHVNIDLIPKDLYKDYVDILELHKRDSEQLTLADAKEQGIIEIEKFNPIKKGADEDLDAPIVVTLSNAYSVGRLKAIDWKGFHEQLELMPSEVTKITGMNTTTLYACLKKVREGSFSFQHSKARIGFTILAKYYERNLGVRTSAKEQNDLLKDKLLKGLRDMELLCDKQQYVKVSAVSKLIGEMRKSLL